MGRKKEIPKDSAKFKKVVAELSGVVNPGAGSRKRKPHIRLKPPANPNWAEDIEEQERKQKEDDKRKEKEEWVAKMTDKGFTCERQVNRSRMGTHPAIEYIERQGLSFFFKKMRMYRKQMVKTFYENMVVKSENEIASQVGGKTVIVTADTIAAYLQYKRPDYRSTSITQPKDNGSTG